MISLILFLGLTDRTVEFKLNFLFEKPNKTVKIELSVS
jgi:hypothetical protein